MSRGFSPAAFAGFSFLFRPWMSRRIGAIHLAGVGSAQPAGEPMILVANHTSWWDAFLLWEIRRTLRPSAPMHTLMLASELRRSPFLGRIGAIGFDPGVGSSFAHALREVERRTELRPDSLVFFFPQGRIFPAFRRPLGFRRGVELLARRLPSAAIVPVGVHLQPMTGPAPHAWVSAGVPIPALEAPSATRLEAAVEAELDAILGFLSMHGEDAPCRWPQPTGVLPRGPRPRPSARNLTGRHGLEPALPEESGAGPAAAFPPPRKL